MKTTQKLKDQIFRELQCTGMFKQMQSKLKTQVLSMVDKQSSNLKQQLNFQYQHPLLNKLRKYPLTSLCIDLIQQFLQSFKFKYTLSVFRKQINKDNNITINRRNLANNFKIQINNLDNQAVLLGIVGQLVSGEVKIDMNRQYNNGNNNQFNSNNHFSNNNNMNNNNNNLRVNNFIGNNNNNSNSNNNDISIVSKSNNQQSSLSSNSNNNISNSNSNSNIKSNPLSSNQTSIQQKSNNNNNKDNSEKKQQKQVQKQVIPQVKQDKNKKPSKKKKQVQKPPEGASDLMGDLMSKFKTKDVKQQIQKKNKIFQQKRAFSQQKVKKVVDPSESGTNQIRGMSMGKMNSFMSKFYNNTTNTPNNNTTTKNQSYIQEQLDQFQQSKDSTRKNPLFSSSQSGFDKSGYYDQSVDSNAIEDFQYVQKAKKFNKKF